MSQDKIEWVKPGVLARSSRPGWWDDRALEVVVSEWTDRVQAMGVRSIICLLSKRELTKFYGQHGIDLLQRYASAGFTVTHLPATDHKAPPLTAGKLRQLGPALAPLPGPWLTHCSAGIDRTGSAIAYLLAQPELLHHPVKKAETP